MDNDYIDVLPLDPIECADDDDSVGNNAGLEDCNDLVSDDTANRQLIANVNKANADSDGFGSAYDSDDDSDTVLDDKDNCPVKANLDQWDSNNNGAGDAKAGDRYLSWAFSEAAHFALLYDERAKRFINARKQKRMVFMAIHAVARAGQSDLLHAVQPERVRFHTYFFWQT